MSVKTPGRRWSFTGKGRTRFCFSRSLHRGDAHRTVFHLAEIGRGVSISHRPSGQDHEVWIQLGQVHGPCVLPRRCCAISGTKII